MRTDLKALAAADALGIINDTGHAVSSADRAGRTVFNAFAASLTFVRNAINAVVSFADEGGATFSPAVLVPLVSIFI